MLTGTVGRVIAGVAALVVLVLVAGLGGADSALTGIGAGSDRSARLGYSVQAEVEPDGTLSGKVSVITTRDAVRPDWGSEAAFYRQADAMLPVHAEDVRSSDTFLIEGRIGKEYHFRRLPVDRFAVSGMLHDFRWEHDTQADTWQVDGRLRMVPGGEPDALRTIGTGTRADIRVTFPGPVLSVLRGGRDEDDDRTVVWTPRFGDDFAVSARAEDGSSWPPDGRSVLSVLVALLVVGGVLVLAGVVVYRQRKQDGVRAD